MTPVLSREPQPPAGYDLAESITPPEIQKLCRQVGMKNANLYETPEDIDERALAVVGVRTRRGKLVAFADLIEHQEPYETERHGEIAIAIVHKKHRKNGLGRFLVEKRVYLADQAGLTHLHAYVEKDNPMKHVYEELGFVAETSISRDIVRVRPDLEQV